MRRRHTYRVTLTPVTGSGEPLASSSSIVLTHHNHDDLAGIVMLVRESSGLDARFVCLDGDRIIEGPLQDFVVSCAALNCGCCRLGTHHSQRRLIRFCPGPVAWRNRAKVRSPALC